MTQEMARMARQKGCNHCCWFKRQRSVVVGEVHPYGYCQVDAPRTGSKGSAWPSVMQSDWCSNWLPVGNLEVG